MTAAAKLRLALDRLLAAFPLYGNIVAQGIFEAARIPTMAVTLRARKLIFLYSVSFVRTHSLEELTAVLEHETLHVILKHLEKDPSAYPDRAARTIAEEVTANEMVASGPLPGEPLTISGFGLPPGESTHARYLRLVRNPKGVPSNRKLVRQPGKSVQPNGKSGRGCRTSDQILGIPTVDDHSQWPTAMAAADREVLERVVGRAAGETTMDRINELPSAVRRAIRGFSPADPPQSATIAVNNSGSGSLLACLRQIAKKTPTWKRKSRRHPDAAVPGAILQRLRVLCAIDTSGSMDIDALSTINGVLRAIAAEHDVWIIECDDRIRAMFRYRRPLRSVRGRGNTDLRPPFASSVFASVRPHAIVYATDGGGEAPASAPPIPVFWAITRGGGAPAVWGRSIYLTDPLDAIETGR
jgi:hypothetical protein